MCGIAGVLSAADGGFPFAARAKRLDTVVMISGIATLGSGGTERRRAEGVNQSASCLTHELLAGSIGRPPAGPPMASRTRLCSPHVTEKVAGT